MSNHARPTSSSTAGPRRAVTSEPFGTLADRRDVTAYTLTNGGLVVRFLSYGGIIQSLHAPDRDGRMADLTPGYDSLGEYVADRSYFGALIGRYANRIGRARFALDGEEYRLPANDGPNHLHGGPLGFHKVVWQVEPFARGTDVGAVLGYLSRDGEEGYPGSLRASVTYTLTADATLVLDYEATTDRATPVNLTQHTYLALGGLDGGDGCDILDHELLLPASRYTPVDAGLIPTGELRPVAGSAFDFRAARAIGARIGDADEQLARGKGYDHNFVLDRERDGLALAARLRDPCSGRTLEISTTEPGIQFYSGNYLGDGAPGKGGRVYGYRTALALETQHFPDSPNEPAFPSTILRPGKRLSSQTVYRFGVDRAGSAG